MVVNDAGDGERSFRSSVSTRFADSLIRHFLPYCIYNKAVAISFDPAKNERNIRERGLSFERAADFDFATAVFNTEVRKGETRRIAVGYLDTRLHLLCYIPSSDGIRVISFRKTNKREAKRYGKPQIQSQTIDEQ